MASLSFLAGRKDVAQISRGTSIMLLIVYGCYLLFQLYTHNAVFMDKSPKSEVIGWRGRLDPKGEDADPSHAMAQIGASVAGGAVNRGNSMMIDAETKKKKDADNLAEAQEEEEQPQLTVLVALITLLFSTVLVALCAEYMVSSINDLVTRGGISETFGEFSPMGKTKGDHRGPFFGYDRLTRTKINSWSDPPTYRWQRSRARHGRDRRNKGQDEPCHRRCRRIEHPNRPARAAANRHHRLDRRQG